MTSAPYMPLFVSDYIGDTMHLKAREHGAYLLLIMNYWMTGKPLPNDPEMLAAIARVDEDDWPEVWRRLSRFFDEGDGVLRHKRVDKELEIVREKAQKARDNGRKGAARRWREGSDPNSDPNGDPIDPPSSSDGETMAIRLGKGRQDSPSATSTTDAAREPPVDPPP